MKHKSLICWQLKIEELTQTHMCFIDDLLKEGIHELKTLQSSICWDL